MIFIQLTNIKLNKTFVEVIDKILIAFSLIQYFFSIVFLLEKLNY